MRKMLDFVRKKKEKNSSLKRNTIRLKMLYSCLYNVISYAYERGIIARGVPRTPLDHHMKNNHKN